MKKTAEDYRQEAREAYEREERSFQRSDTDGFVSQWCSNLSGQLADAKADLLEAGRKGLFIGLYDKRGKRVRAKLITTKFHGHSSMSWLLRMDEEERYGRKWVPYGQHSRIQKQLGLTEEYEYAPAWAKIFGNGTGLSGLASARIVVFRTGCPWGSDATLAEDMPVKGGA